MRHFLFPKLENRPSSYLESEVNAQKVEIHMVYVHRCTSTSVSWKLSVIRLNSIACLCFLCFLVLYMRTETIHFNCLHLSSLLTLNVFVDFSPLELHFISVRKCVSTREAVVSGGADVLSKVACLC